MKIVAVYDIKNADGEVVFKEGDQIYSVNRLTGNRAELSMYKEGMELMQNKKEGVTAKETGCPFLYASTIEHCAELDMPSIHLSHGVPLPGLSMTELRKDTPVKERFSSMLIVDVNVNALFSVLQEPTGMGESGESYLVGKVEGKEGYWMLSQSRLTNENTIFTRPINTTDAKRVLDEKITERGAGFCQNNIYQDYRGTNVLGHNHYVKLGENGLALMTEIDEAEVFQASSQLMLFIVIIIAGLSILVAVVSLLIANMFAKPIIKLSDYAAEIGIGNFDIIIDKKLLTKKDELGTLSGSFDTMIESLQYKGNMVEEVAKGNLTIEVELASDKDILGTSLVQMTNSLNSLLGNVNMSVDQVNIGADQVSQASQSLSQGATESAASLEEISASVTQINSQSRQNAENATEANGLAKQATEDAQKGNKEMESLSEAMTKINESSDQIKKIVKVIDDIAFQTNLLALNANVEAARAGKYGKGFAVVADEVRNLAVRSAEAVKETTVMVDESIKNIDSGNKAVEATATQLESIMGG
ncbi:MAG: methyl-accepting chemotaxis protein, partial [Spirochaetaceae bacterium]|nr:methyl-accepting chemotaxis protein [Spirochaetaceae bacterium]